jgi:hypothetical protein
MLIRSSLSLLKRNSIARRLKPNKAVFWRELLLCGRTPSPRHTGEYGALEPTTAQTSAVAVSAFVRAR